MLSESATTRLEVPFRTKTPEFHQLLLEQIRAAASGASKQN
jgi:hypothetical protein